MMTVDTKTGYLFGVFLCLLKVHCEHTTKVEVVIGKVSEFE